MFLSLPLTIILSAQLGLRLCTKCLLWKSSVGFYPSRISQGLLGYCKECDNTYINRWKKSHPEKTKDWNSSLQQRHPDRAAKYTAEWRGRNPEHRRQSTLRKYGMTNIDYFTMLSNQEGGCAVCGEIPSKKALAVDHNHVTGKVRDLLCDGCNRALGYVSENPKTLRALADYLDFHKETTCL